MLRRSEFLLKLGNWVALVYERILEVRLYAAGSEESIRVFEYSAEINRLTNISYRRVHPCFSYTAGKLHS